MDSMRSLNTSLPSSTPRPQPPEQLLQSFKAAALSVTNLYKNAVYEQAQARQAGYQEAVEDLLHFLDRENLGLGDGEGWRVRQWATEKCDGTAQGSDDDERTDPDKPDRSATPAAGRKEAPSSEPAARQQPTSAPASVPSAPPMPRPETTTTTPTPQAHPQEISPGSPPTLVQRSPQCQDLEMDVQSSDNPTPPLQDDAPVSISMMPRNPRHQHRHNNLARPIARPFPRESPASIGSKRKFNVPDFFDLSGDMFGGGKRGRFT
ncbi:hypothetical protein N7526_007603 [Penicillium atrosanguineum]|nr:hypothetical protein N7526_007603 [Penicillium atrosanguineum]